MHLCYKEQACICDFEDGFYEGQFMLNETVSERALPWCVPLHLIGTSEGCASRSWCYVIDVVRHQIFLNTLSEERELLSVPSDRPKV